LSASRPKISSLSCPSVTVNFLRSMPAKDLNAAPVVRRQPEQWQFMAYVNSSATA
jgi:hypothetical protein